MAAPFSGGCARRAVRYECSAEPLMMGNCHCRDCQRASGGPFVSIGGRAEGYAQDYWGGQIPRSNGVTVGAQLNAGFVTSVGPVLFGFPARGPFVGVSAGSLDDPSWYRPTFDIYTSSAQPWDYMNPELAKFPKMPPM